MLFQHGHSHSAYAWGCHGRTSKCSGDQEVPGLILRCPNVSRVPPLELAPCSHDLHMNSQVGRVSTQGHWEINNSTQGSTKFPSSVQCRAVATYQARSLEAPLPGPLARGPSVDTGSPEYSRTCGAQWAGPQTKLRSLRGPGRGQRGVH